MTPAETADYILLHYWPFWRPCKTFQEVHELLARELEARHARTDRVINAVGAGIPRVPSSPHNPNS